MFNDLISNILDSTLQGVIGVMLIFIYFFVIIAVSLYRIKKGEHMDH